MTLLGAESSLTENVLPPFQAEPTHHLHVVAQFTFRIVPTVAFTTGDSSHLWLCHVGLPPQSSLVSYLRTRRAGGEGNRSFTLWKDVTAVENMQGDAKVSSANDHRKTLAAASKREVEHGRCKTNEQSKGSAPFSAGVSGA
jgi:hypothetical protein